MHLHLVNSDGIHVACIPENPGITAPEAARVVSAIADPFGIPTGFGFLSEFADLQGVTVDKGGTGQAASIKDTIQGAALAQAIRRRIRPRASRKKAPGVVCGDTPGVIWSAVAAIQSRPATYPLPTPKESLQGPSDALAGDSPEVIGRAHMGEKPDGPVRLIYQAFSSWMRRPHQPDRRARILGLMRDWEIHHLMWKATSGEGSDE